MMIRLLMLLSLLVIFSESFAQFPGIETALDQKVKSFLEVKEPQWRDMNVPLADGKILYDLIIEHGYKDAVEIGTSTGHSAIWIAWALSKTGGKLITIEIDPDRYAQAKANFEKAGLSKYIDIRLGDAHELIPKLTGKYDFVFCDADKLWYKNYFSDMDQKLVFGGCFAAHNTASRTPGIREFLEYAEKQKNYQTTIIRKSQAGISVSYKTE